MKKWALITGASVGIGDCFARLLASEGYNLVINARSKDKLEERAEFLRKSYNIGTPVEAEVLHGIDAELAEGEFCALIGPSGSGKSTLLKCLGAVIDPSAQVAASAHIGPFVSIGARSVVGENCIIGTGSVIGEDCSLDSGCELIARVTLVTRVKLGKRVRIHPGAVLGADGFGRDGRGRERQGVDAWCGGQLRALAPRHRRGDASPGGECHPDPRGTVDA